MIMYRTNGLAPVFSLRREIDRLFDDTFSTTNGDRRMAWMPAVDVREDDREFRFDLELPGVSPSDVEVTADNGVLTVRGQKGQRSEREADQGRFHIVERSYGSFVRSFQLPQGVQEDGIAATFENGLLSVRVPKAPRPQPRRIEIGGQPAAVSSGNGADAAEQAQPSKREKATARTST
jgi:HSP20 family protein